MACLSKDDEGWYAWAVELVRRGLYPMDSITVHGPHGYPADFMWGEAECCKGMDGDYHEVKFRSRRPCRGIWDIHGVTVWEEGGWGPVTFPILKAKELTPRWKRLLSTAQKKRVEVREAAMAARAF